MQRAWERRDSNRTVSRGVSMVGYRRLAVRVIELAFRDLECASPALRLSARAFLAGHPALFLWCDLAEIRAARVIARAGQQDQPASGGAANVSEPLGQTAAGALTKLAIARSSVS